uniref:Delta-6 fatty acid desaturase n=1 Tax=Prorocentrum micans TaxID=2945 RepID=A0AAU7E3N6_PROMC
MVTAVGPASRSMDDGTASRPTKNIHTADSADVAEESAASTDAGSPRRGDSDVDTPAASKGFAEVPQVPEAACNPKLWYIHGQAYDLSGFVDKHPGGRLAILSGRGRDCTALFESYHPWNDRHRKVLKSFGPAPPPPDPFYEEIKARVREVFPKGGKETKMRLRTKIVLSALWCVMIYLFFGVRTPLSCALSGVLMATVGTRLAHEGGHYQVSSREWVNRLALFLGYFPTGPSMGWHYRHVISHHAHTNQDGAHSDVDVAYIWIADKLPGWMKVLILPGLPIGVMLEIGVKTMFELVVVGSMAGHRSDRWLGHMLPEALVWLAVHLWFGPSCLCYALMYFTAGAIFVPTSQVAHAIVFPDQRDHSSWAKMQIAESVDFASTSDFWFHLAMGLTTQVEHHLFPGVGHHCYNTIRLITREVCAKHGVTHYDISAKKAFGALWTRWISGAAAHLD